MSGLAVALVRNTIFLLSGKDEAGWIGTLASLVSSICLVGGEWPPWSVTLRSH